MPYRVRAKQIGYYDHQRRKPGAEFTIHQAQHFSETWMEALDAIPKRKSSSRKSDLPDAAT